MTPRSLVGMTMGARKRRARAVTYVALNEVTFIDTAEALAAPTHCARFHARKFPRHEYDLQMYKFVRLRYRIGQRLRPCPGCAQCLRCLCGNSAACIGLYEAWTKHQKAEPACNDCCGHGCEDGHCDKVDDICDGSGVLPARARKVRR
jgi:hypothetical protein